MMYSVNEPSPNSPPPPPKHHESLISRPTGALLFLLPWRMHLFFPLSLLWIVAAGSLVMASSDAPLSREERLHRYLEKKAKLDAAQEKEPAVLRLLPSPMFKSFVLHLSIISKPKAVLLAESGETFKPNAWEHGLRCFQLRL